MSLTEPLPAKMRQEAAAGTLPVVETPAGVRGKTAPRVAGKAATKAAMRKAIFAFHLWVGLALSVWFVLLALTGSALIFKPQVDTLLNPSLRRSAPPTPGAAQLSPDEALVLARAVYPDVAFKRMGLPEGPNGVYEFRYGGEKQERELFLHAYTGAVLGERSHHDHPMEKVLEFHKALLLGAAGEQVNGIGALLLVGLLATGVYLWWPANAKQWSQRLTVKTNASTKRLLFDLHNAFGVYTLPVLLLIAMTGAVFIYKKPVESALYAMTGTALQPEKEKYGKEKKGGPGKKSAHEKQHPVPEIRTPLAGLLAASEAAAPGTYLKHLDLPDRVGKPVRVHRERRSGFWVNNKLRYQFDPTTGALLEVEDERRDPLPKQLLRWNGPLHEGKIAGPATQWLYLVIALIAPLGLVVTGAVKWYQTSRSQAKNRSRKAAGSTAANVAR